MYDPVPTRVPASKKFVMSLFGNTLKRTALFTISPTPNYSPARLVLIEIYDTFVCRNIRKSYTELRNTRKKERKGLGLVALTHTLEFKDETYLTTRLGFMTLTDIAVYEAAPNAGT